jgi:hypothetical protein
MKSRKAFLQALNEKVMPLPLRVVSVLANFNIATLIILAVIMYVIFSTDITTISYNFTAI